MLGLQGFIYGPGLDPRYPAPGRLIPFSKESCELALDQCKRGDPVIQAILKRWESRQPPCEIPNHICTTCGSDTSYDAAYDPNRRLITICANRMMNGLQVCRALAHELMHHESQCDGTYPSRDGGCPAIICEERRAIERSGQCCRNSWYRRNPPLLCGGPANRNWSYAECVRCYTDLSSGWRCGTRMPPPPGQTNSITFHSDFNECPAGTPNCTGLGGL